MGYGSMGASCSVLILCIVNGMFNSTIVDVVIGLLFVYLLLAIIVTTVNEWIAGLLNARAANLKAAITQLLDNQPGDPKNIALTNWFVDQFYAHPLIEGMRDQSTTPTKGHPSYLPARAFATVVMDIVTPEQHGPITFQDLQNGITNLPPGDVRKALLAVIQNTDKKLSTAQKNIEDWFDDTMQRVGGWYKRKTQLWTFSAAVLLTVFCNADTIRMTYILWRNPVQRAQIVEAAKSRSGHAGGPTEQSSKDELTDLDSLLGWGSNNKTAPESDNPYEKWARRILGWFLTVVAVSLGAPFWFDLLNKIVNLRDAGRKPQTEDSPSPAPPAPTQAATQTS